MAEAGAAAVRRRDRLISNVAPGRISRTNADQRILRVTLVNIRLFRPALRQQGCGRDDKSSAFSVLFSFMIKRSPCIAARRVAATSVVFRVCCFQQGAGLINHLLTAGDAFRDGRP